MTYFDVIEIAPTGGRPLEVWFDVRTHLIQRVVGNGQHNHICNTIRKIQIGLDVGVIEFSGQFSGILRIPAIYFTNPVSGLFHSLREMPRNVS